MERKARRTSRRVKKTFAHGNSAIWKTQCFKDVFLDVMSVKRIPEDGKIRQKALKPASNDPLQASALLIDVLESVLDNRADWVSYYSNSEIDLINDFIQILEDAKNIQEKLPSIDDSQKFAKLAEVIKLVTARFMALGKGDFIMIPVSWWVNCNQKSELHSVYMLFENRGSSFAVTVSNFGPGLEFHPFSYQPEDHDPGQVHFKHSIVIEDIPPKRLFESWFWFALFRLRLCKTYEKESAGGTAFFYETLLPFLNDQSLGSILYFNSHGVKLSGEEKEPAKLDSSMVAEVTGVDFRAAAVNGEDPSTFNSLLEVLKVYLKKGGISPGAEEHFGILVLWELCMFLKEDLDVSEKVNVEELRFCSGAIDQLISLSVDNTNKFGMFACKDLVLLQKFYDDLSEKLNSMIRQLQATKTTLVFENPSEILNVKFQPFPLFERLRREESVEHLAGPEQLPPVLRPVQFSKIPKKVSNVLEALSAMRNAEELCTCLAYQTDLIENSCAFRAALIEDLFLDVLPIPIAFNSSETVKCLWREPIRREVQVEALRLLKLLSRHYLVCSVSIIASRSFDSKRASTMAAILSISDILMRTEAIDVASLLSLHYSGRAPKTPAFEIAPFGLDASMYSTQSQYMKFYDPRCACVRTKILDYFFSQKSFVKNDHIIFDFEGESEASGSLVQFFKQICWEIGFPTPVEELNYHLFLTEDYPEILDTYPEIEHFRDIVFTFKLLSSAYNDTLPEVKSWYPSDAKFTWKYRPKAGYYVTAFGGKVLKCNQDSEESDEVKGKGVAKVESNFLGFSSSLISVSGADPSTLVGKPVFSEEDILHIRNLPDFGGRLSQKDSELLLSYLTVPYLRIPLLLHFFSEADHVQALGAPEVQEVLDSAIFEPGIFLPDPISKKVEVPNSIPSKTRDHLSTPSGLLMNELLRSSTGILFCVSKMLEHVLDQNTGRYTQGTAPMILYIIRLYTRIEGYLKYFVDHYDDPGIRGLSCEEDYALLLAKKRAEMRLCLNSHVFTLLDKWLEYAIKKDHISEACEIQAHIAYIYMFIPYEELNEQIVISITASILFLTSQHDFNVSPKKGEKIKRSFKKKYSSYSENTLGISDYDVFSLFQYQRMNIFRWFEDNSERLNETMENIISVVTLNSEGYGLGPSNQGKIRFWRHMDGRDCLGRFVPSKVLRTDEEYSQAELARPYLRAETEVDVELNLQLGTLTLNSRLLRPLDNEISSMVDFENVFGSALTVQKNKGKQYQCADVKRTTKRLWVRLIGRRHDLMFWEPDDRNPNVLFTRSFTFESVSRRERWIAEALAPYIGKISCLSNLKLFLPPRKQMKDRMDYAKLIGIGISNQQGDDSHVIMREIIVFSKNNVVHVYNVLEYGRRLYRTIVFSSDSSWSFQGMKYLNNDTVPPTSDFGFLSDCKDISLESSRRRTLVISRNFGIKEEDGQVYLPSRFLRGLLPSCLIEQFEFWQNHNDNITGYKKSKKSGNQGSELLQIEFLELEASEVEEPDEDDEDETKKDKASKSRSPSFGSSTDVKSTKLKEFVRIYKEVNGKKMFLINVMYSRYVGALSKLAEYFAPIEDLSNVLFWTNDEVYFPNDPCKIERIELTRLGLSFQTRLDSNGNLQLFCEDHHGMFVSSKISPKLSSFTDGIPHAMILENEMSQYAMLLPAYPPLLRHGFVLSSKLGEILRDENRKILCFDRQDAEWMKTLESRHYYYPIHVSGAFQFTTSLQSSFYFLLLKFLNRDYEKVFQLADSCASDVTLSSEEHQIFKKFSMTNSDSHPDAIACRLKLILLMSHSNCAKDLWKIEQELNEYIRKRQLVSANCRFTLEEEILLLSMCTAKTFEMENRKLILNSILNGSSQIKLIPWIFRPNLDQEFDGIQDKTCIDPDDEKREKDLKKESKMIYERPEFTDAGQVLEYLNKWFSHGMKLKGGKDNLGFLFLYELLTCTIEMRIVDHDSTYHLGCLLCRMLPSSEYQVRSLNMSLLRMLMLNPEIAYKDSIPALGERKKNRFIKPIFASADAGYLKLIKELVPWIRGHAAGIKWGYKNPLFALKLTAIDLSLPSFGNLPRVWKCPRIKSSARDIRPLCAVPNDSKIPFPEKDVENFATIPMFPINLKDFVTSVKARDKKFASDFPFDFSKHPLASGSLYESTIGRYKSEWKAFIDQQSEEISFELKYFAEGDIMSYLKSNDSASLKKAIDSLIDVRSRIIALKNIDEEYMESGIKRCADLANEVGLSNARPQDFESDDPYLKSQLCFSLKRTCRQEPLISFNFLVLSLLSWESLTDLESLNPYLNEESAKVVLDLTVATLLHANRISLGLTCLAQVDKLLKELISIKPNSKQFDDSILTKSILMSSRDIALNLMTPRTYLTIGTVGKNVLEGKHDSWTGYLYDPRFLVFEFSQAILLKKAQVEMVKAMISSVGNPEKLGMCQQMIMGAGKTTTVGPLVALILSETYEIGEEGITCQIVPKPLLEFSRTVLRERFSALLVKPIYTFEFSRFNVVDEQLLKKIKVAAKYRGILISHPTAIKAFMLKFVELLNIVDASRIDASYTQAEVVSCKKQIEICQQILQLFRKGNLLLDEVDLILHPLKSELNFPVGKKDILDFTRSKLYGSGLRWEIPFRLINALLMKSMSMKLTSFENSREAAMILQNLSSVLKRGMELKFIQHIPHLVLLNAEFYHSDLKPLLIKWMVLWIDSLSHSNLSSKSVLDFLSNEKRDISSKLTKQQVDLLDDDLVKLLNLSYDWLHTYFPFILSKVDRVSYGLLSATDLERALRIDHRMPKSRKLTAVPFVGKDVPSQSSEFAHPDIVIGLTILAFRYEGLRKSDFLVIMKALQQELWKETGTVHKRPSARLFQEWVSLAGGRVRGSTKKIRLPLSQEEQFLEFEEKDVASEVVLADMKKDEEAPEIWPLHLIDLNDPEQFEPCYSLLFSLSQLSYHYLSQFVFPTVMKRQSMKLSASGQSLGGQMIFSRRIGFSGTPSELVPLEFNGCNYEKGSDGKMLHFLTSEHIASFVDGFELVKEWSIRSLLDLVANSVPQFHALIDTGALITGMSNYDVALYLLTKGLVNMDGVVFLDDEDRKVILLRNGLHVVPLDKCGIPLEKRFTFYDHIHTTGMDIKQPLVCQALLTLGKDMTFRDYAQGAFRMRGIGKGQTIKLYLIPEVRQLIIRNVKLCGKESPLKSETKVTNVISALQDVTAWLILNGIKSERVQFKMLCEQNMSNLWRKRALEILLLDYKKVGQEDYKNETQESQLIFKSLDVFRERMDFSIENGIPKIESLSDKLEKMSSLYESLIYDSDWKIVDYIKALIKGNAELHSPDFDIKKASKFELKELQDNVKGFDSENMQEDEQEDEQEQEQEQEVLQEAQQEVEALIEDESFQKKTYVIKENDPYTWTLEQLRVPEPSEHKMSGFPFYQAAQCKLYKEGSDLGTKPIGFPSYVMLSQNYFNRESFKIGHKRLKNVVMFLEWIPNKGNLKELLNSTFSGINVDSKQLENIRRACSMFDTDGSESLSESIFLLLLKGLGAHLPSENFTSYEEFGMKSQFPLKFKDFSNLAMNQPFNKIEKGRFFAVISLEEAECIRGLLHQTERKELFSGLSLSLRIGGRILEKSFGYLTGPEYQGTVALQCMRFFNSEYNFSDRQVSVILRSLQSAPADVRLSFFEEIRSCRRRAPKDVTSTSLQPVFRMLDEYSLFEFRSIISAIRYLMKKKGLGVLDAFKTFDVVRDGLIYCSELYGGLEWLGLKLIPDDIYAIVRYVDSTGDGRIRYADFLKAFGDPENVDPTGFLDKTLEKSVGKQYRQQKIEMKVIKELYEAKATNEKNTVAEFDSDVLAKMQVKKKEIEHWAFIWDTSGTKARKAASIWAPDIDTYLRKRNFRKNKVRTCVSHYVIGSLARKSGSKKKPPSELFGLTIDLTDRNTNMLFKSSNLSEAHVNHLMPHPIKFKLVWSKSGGDLPLFIWKSLAPENFISLGMVATMSDEPPPLTSVRCVPKRWTKQVSDPPKLIWEDTGSGGKRGSFWKVNSLGVLWATEGLDPPEGPFYDLVANKLYASEYYEKDAHKNLLKVANPFLDQAGQDSDSDNEIVDGDEATPVNKTPPLNPSVPNSAASIGIAAIEAKSQRDKLKAQLSQTLPPPSPISQYLPEGWSEEKDPTTGDIYFFNSKTGQSQWESPVTSAFVSPLASPRLPTGWEQVLDDDSGEYYFYNSKTGETQWERPT